MDMKDEQMQYGDDLLYPIKVDMEVLKSYQEEQIRINEITLALMMLPVRLMEGAMSNRSLTVNKEEK